MRRQVARLFSEAPCELPPHGAFCQLFRRKSSAYGKDRINHFYGGVALTLTQTEYPEQLHDWAREEQYKADAQEHAMIYYMKTKFEDLTLATYSDQFSGPLYVQVFHPAETVNDVLTITCHWYDGIFRNDYYVIGVIANTADLDGVIKNIIS